MGVMGWYVLEWGVLGWGVLRWCVLGEGEAGLCRS